MQWHKLRPHIKSDDDEQLWKKLELEWSYNSNHMEGNTLTYHETELLLIHDRTAGAHPLRDYEEMKAHSVAIAHVRSIARSEQAIGAVDIRNINRIILKEPFWKYTESLDGQPTRKRIVPGDYKIQPNHVRTHSGKIHRFSEPSDTPAFMQKWVEGFRSNMQTMSFTLPLFLAESHWIFLCIHPFDDGNGRTARLLTNYALLRNNLLPIVIKTQERDRYIGGLQHADIGHILPLAEFMLDNLLWSLTLGMRAAKGESIQEPDDLDKEINVFVRGRRSRAPSASDIEAIDNVVLACVRPTLDKLQSSLHRLAQLFRTYSSKSYLVIGGSRVQMTNLFEPRNWEPMRQERVAKAGFFLDDERPVELGAEFRFHTYIGEGTKDFGLTLAIAWTLGAKSFSMDATIDGHDIGNIGTSHTRYSEIFVQDGQVEHMVTEVCKAAMTEIEKQSQSV